MSIISLPHIFMSRKIFYSKSSDSINNKMNFQTFLWLDLTSSKHGIEDRNMLCRISLSNSYWTILEKIGTLWYEIWRRKKLLSFSIEICRGRRDRWIYLELTLTDTESNSFSSCDSSSIGPNICVSVNWLVDLSDCDEFQE